MYDIFREVMQKEPKLEASIAVCSAEIKAEKEISYE